MPLLPLASAISYFQAVVLGVLQGATELFPISSLGHTVLFPTLFGWNRVVAMQSQTESPWLAFVVLLHVGSALGLLWFFRRDWVEIIRAFFRTLSRRRIETPTERLAWLIIVASIPAGILGLALEHTFRTLTAKPLAAAIGLMVNGLILFAAEHYRRRAEVRALALKEGAKADGGRELRTLAYREALVIGVAQSTGLVAGISREGVTMGAAFLMATPIILAAGVFKVGDLTGANGAGIRGQAAVACVAAAITAVFTVRFLVNYFRTRTLTPFAVYCLLFGLAMIIYTQS